MYDAEIEELSPRTRLSLLFKNGILLPGLIFGLLALAGAGYSYLLAQQQYQARTLVLQQWADASEVIGLSSNRLSSIRTELLDLKAITDQIQMVQPDVGSKLIDRLNQISQLTDTTSQELSAIDLPSSDLFKLQPRIDWTDLGNFVIGPAHAGELSQTAAPAPAPELKSDIFKQLIVIAVIAAITLLFVVCIVLYCVTKDKDKVKFADSMMRTIVGFYIGVVTGLLGLAS